MFQRKPRRFSRRPNGRGHSSHRNGSGQGRPFSNGQTRNNFRQTLSAEKLFEKYSTLAKEAMTSGDKTLSENYFQHADHFMRVIEEKNRNQNVSKPINSDQSQSTNQNSVEINENKDLADKDKTIK
jgi:hypothetical protein